MAAEAYLKLIRAPGIPRLVFAFLALGIANTMTPVAFVLFARSATHSFASASLVLAASTAGGLLFGPLRGRLVDRVGARDAVLWVVIPDVVTDIGFIAAGHAHARAGILIGLAFVAGAVTAPALAALRTVWSDALADRTDRHAGFAVMSMMAETNFIAGPLVAGLLIALWSATATVAATAVLSLLGAVAFATAPGARARGPQPAAARRLGALAGAGIRTVVGTSLAFGLTFGLLDVAFPAFARTHGSAAASGVLLSAFAVGSWGGGFAYGLRPRSRSAGALYPPLCLLAAAGFAPLIATPGLPVMVAFAVVSGLCYAPITNCQLAVIDEVAQEGHKAEAFTWLGTLYGAGLAIGAAVAGQLIASASIRAAIAVACGATALAGLVALLRAGSLRTGAAR